jgi:hypothetical protein
MTYIKGSPSHFTEDMTETITVYKQSTLDNYGKRATAVSGTTYSARVMSEIRRSRNDEGEINVEGGKLIVLNDVDIAVGDRLVLPGSNEPVILAVDKVTYSANGTTAVHHTLVTFGRG